MTSAGVSITDQIIEAVKKNTPSQKAAARRQLNGLIQGAKSGQVLAGLKASITRKAGSNAKLRENCMNFLGGASVGPAKPAAKAKAKAAKK